MIDLGKISEICFDEIEEPTTEVPKKEKTKKTKNAAPKKKRIQYTDSMIKQFMDIYNKNGGEMSVSIKEYNTKYNKSLSSSTASKIVSGVLSYPLLSFENITKEIFDLYKQSRSRGMSQLKCSKMIADKYHVKINQNSLTNMDKIDRWIAKDESADNKIETVQLDGSVDIALDNLANEISAQIGKLSLNEISSIQSLHGIQIGELKDSVKSKLMEELKKIDIIKLFIK